jgi:hypothetical protein
MLKTMNATRTLMVLDMTTFKVFLLEVLSLNFTDTKFVYNFLNADGLHPKYFMSVVLKGFKSKGAGGLACYHLD